MGCAQKNYPCAHIHFNNGTCQSALIVACVLGRIEKQASETQAIFVCGINSLLILFFFNEI